MKYRCEICDYKTDINSNYSKHLKTEKHALKMKQGDELDSQSSEGILRGIPSIPKSIPKSIPEVYPSIPKVYLDDYSMTRIPKYFMNTSSIPKTQNENTENTSILYNCQYCNRHIKHKGNFYKHRKLCRLKTETGNIVLHASNSVVLENEILKQRLEYESKLKETEKKMEIERRMREILEKQVEDLKDDKQFSNKVTENTNKIADKIADRSMSALNFVIKNMNDAPILKALPNDDIKKMLDYGDKSDAYMVESVIFAYQTSTITKLLGDAIIKNYKKDNPKLQSLWNTDVSRLTYLVRLTVHDEEDWVVDKQGVRTNKIIIEPFLIYIRDKVLYAVKNFHKFEKLKALTDIDFLKYATSFVNDIDNGNIKDEIIKYIAPYLALEKTEHKTNPNTAKVI
jgi:hypothetical protein